MKSVKSEDLFKDLQVNPRISPQTVKDFMMNWMDRVEIKICGPTERSSFQMNTHYSSERKVGQQRLCKWQPLT